MTKNRIEALANVLHKAHPETTDFAPDEETVDGFMRAVEAVADVCEAFNPKFDRVYFMAWVVQGPKAKRQREV